MENIESKSTVFGYTFADPVLLAEALTTPAYKMENPAARDNQRLEVLGDAVLGLLAAEAVFLADGAREGRLTVRRSHMVSTAALCAAAKRQGLKSRLRVNRGAAELSDQSKTMADAVEAILGAVYLDGGFEAARGVFAALELTEHETDHVCASNPKGDLQELVQSMKPPRHPVYALVRTVGSAHAPVFTVRVEVEGVGSAEAEAGSRHEAEVRAANALLLQIRPKI